MKNSFLNSRLLKKLKKLLLHRKIDHFHRLLQKEVKQIINISKLDVDHRRDDDASPMSSYRCMLRPT